MNRKMFECGCCGTGFLSTRREQAKHDQDKGYGICPSCETWIGAKQDAEQAKIEAKVRAALKPANQEKFDAMSAAERRGMIEAMHADGLITWEITRGNTIEESKA